jgi:hypothetical protein
LSSQYVDSKEFHRAGVAEVIRVALSIPWDHPGGDKPDRFRILEEIFAMVTLVLGTFFIGLIVGLSIESFSAGDKNPAPVYTSLGLVWVLIGMALLEPRILGSELTFMERSSCRGIRAMKLPYLQLESLWGLRTRYVQVIKYVGLLASLIFLFGFLRADTLRADDPGWIDSTRFTTHELGLRVLTVDLSQQGSVVVALLGVAILFWTMAPLVLARSIWRTSYVLVAALFVYLGIRILFAGARNSAESVMGQLGLTVSICSLVVGLCFAGALQKLLVKWSDERRAKAMVAFGRASCIVPTLFLIVIAFPSSISSTPETPVQKYYLSSKEVVVGSVLGSDGAILVLTVGGARSTSTIAGPPAQRRRIVKTGDIVRVEPCLTYYLETFSVVAARCITGG